MLLAPRILEDRGLRALGFDICNVALQDLASFAREGVGGSIESLLSRVC